MRENRNYFSAVNGRFLDNSILNGLERVVSGHIDRRIHVFIRKWEFKSVQKARKNLTTTRHVLHERKKFLDIVKIDPNLRDKYKEDIRRNYFLWFSENALLA